MNATKLRKWTIEIPNSVPEDRADKVITDFWKSDEISSHWHEAYEGQGPRPVLTRSKIQALIEAHSILCDGAPITASIRLQPGQKIEVEIPEVERPNLGDDLESLKNTDIPVLFEDSHLILINKPQGIVVHPSDTQPQGALTQILQAKGIQLAQAGLPQRPGVVHRIDQWTSGVLVLAKTDACYYELQKLFSEHNIERRYIALVYGRFERAFQKPFPLKTILGRHPADRTRMAVLKNENEGRTAITHFKTLKLYAHASLVEATLETGRTHQVRVHLTSLGHSILGDTVYGVPSDRDSKLKLLPLDARRYLKSEVKGQMLHAKSLGFIHPMTQAKIEVEAPPPSVFQSLESLLI